VKAHKPCHQWSRAQVRLSFYLTRKTIFEPLIGGNRRCWQEFAALTSEQKISGFLRSKFMGLAVMSEDWQFKLRNSGLTPRATEYYSLRLKNMARKMLKWICWYRCPSYYWHSGFACGAVRAASFLGRAALSKRLGVGV